MDDLALYLNPWTLLTTLFYIFYNMLDQHVLARFRPQITNLEIERDETPADEYANFTPKQILQLELNRHKYDKAFEIAEQYDLEKDPVYKAMWLYSDVTLENIQNCLSLAKDTLWVINQCIQKCGHDFESTKNLVELGFDRCENLLDLNEDKTSFIKRLKRYRDRLTDYQSFIDTTGCDFDEKFYLKVRNYSTLRLTLMAAQESNFDMLTEFFCRPKELYKYWLIILDNVNEIDDISLYSHLLPNKENLRGSWDYSKHNPVECKEEEIEPVIWSKIDKEFLLNGDENYQMGIILQWYERRALFIESSTGLTDLAESFLRVAVEEKKFIELSDLLKEISLLRSLNYGRSIDALIGYKSFTSMEPIKIACEFTKHDETNDFGSILFQSIIPLFQYRCEKSSTLIFIDLLTEFLIYRSQISLEPLCSFLNELSKQSKINHRYPELNDHVLIVIVQKCFESCQNENCDQLKKAYREIQHEFDILRTTGVYDDENSNLISTNRRLKALEMLATYNLKLSYEKLTQIANSESETLMLFKRLSRAFIDEALKSRANDKNSQAKKSINRFFNPEHWQSVLRLMSNLASLAFIIDRQKILELVVEAILTSSDPELIKVTRAFLSETEDPNQDKLNLAASQHLTKLSGLAYIDESVNCKDATIDLAKLCFNMAPQKKDVQPELDFLSALPLLEKCGVKDLPLRLKMYVDKQPLVERALDENVEKSTYRDLALITKLCQLLRVPSGNPENYESFALQLCAERALKQDDLQTCQTCCKKLVEKKSRDSWQICYSLAQHPDFDNSTEALELVRFCLGSCDTKDLSSVLNSCKQMKARIRIMKHRQSPLIKDEEFDIESDSTKSCTKPSRKNYNSDQLCGDWFTSFKKDDLPKHELDEILELAQLIEQSINEHDHKIDNDALNQLIVKLADTAFHTLPSYSTCLLCLVDPSQFYQYVEFYLSNPLLTKHDVQLLTVAVSLRFLKHQNPNLTFESLTSLSLREMLSISQNLAKKMENREVNDNDDDDSAELDCFKSTLTMCNAKMNKLDKSRMLIDLPKGSVDEERFLVDDQYRKNAILGFAMTYEDTSFSNSLKLGVQFEIGEWEILWAHLSYLMTGPELDISVLQNYIKKRNLVDRLMPFCIAISVKLREQVWPLLDGKNYSILMLYFSVLEKFTTGYEHEMNMCQTHKKIVNFLAKQAPGVDYKDLISPSENHLDVILPFLNATNFALISKMLIQMPEKSIRLENMLSVWAKKVFFELAPKSGVDQAFEKCSTTLAKLNSRTFMDFSRGILASEKLKTVFQDDLIRCAAIKLCFDFANKNPRLEEAAQELNAMYESSILIQIEQNTKEITTSTGKLGNQTADKSTGLAQLKATVNQLLSEEKFQEAQKLVLDTFQVPAPMATHKTAMFLIKRLNKDS